jgi:UDP-glucuronate 4-epimerase
MRNVLEEYKVTHVLHLAAQAGVRYSLENPLTYVRNNIQCFVVLLEELRRVKANSDNGFVPHLVYASSSSVYGGNKKVPFEEIDPVENPSSLYGLTKRVNELLALVYSRNFGISSLGLRFFTVYGPWGRPDMAPYKFTESILKGGNITVFNHGKMARDFTYIDDIVSGISAALEYQPSSPLILNLGHGNPENVLDLVKIIENYTGRPAKLQFMESIVDLPLTSASVKKAKKLLSYSPRVSLREGMQSFIDWYSLYSGEQSICAIECADKDRCISSPFDDVYAESIEATRNCETVVYTVSFGSHYGLKEPPSTLSCNRGSCCSIAFVTKLGTTSHSNRMWKEILVKADKFLFWDSRRMSRVIKLTPGKFFSPSVKYAIYVDVKLQLNMDPKTLVQMLGDGVNRTASLLAVRHNVNSDPFHERSHILGAKKVLRSATYTVKTMNHQVEQYRKDLASRNMSIGNMIDGALLVHNLESSSGRSFRCAWSKEYYRGSDRDQISFPWILALEANKAGVNLAAGEEWCKISENPPSYVRILSNALHWNKNSRTIADIR